MFIKATEGDDFVDKNFQVNMAGAKTYGHIAGAYHFFHFQYDGLAQAMNFIRTVQKQIQLPPVIDIEFGGNTKHYNINQVKIELSEMINALKVYYDREPILYVTQEAYDAFINGNFNNKLWIRSIIFPLNESMHDAEFWQYHNLARISGIANRVDLNVFVGKQKDFDNLIINYFN